MAAGNGYILMKSLKSFIRNEELSEIFRACRAQRRLRKLDFRKLFFVLLLGYGSGNERRIVGFKRIYEVETGSCPCLSPALGD